MVTTLHNIYCVLNLWVGGSGRIKPFVAIDIE